AVVAAFYGHVRRVVVDAAGVVIDLGRRSRLFTGTARDAAILQGVLDRNGRCTHPGCGRDSHCQIDHLTEWQHGGSTDLVNAGIGCGHHNRVKSTSGFSTRRDPHGHWHTYRPDHTEIRAA
ncbi:HNH endonuclease signature motif containing protein, partial [Desertimonas flava]|uniref:HNH endonuclease signature motif containing protein n=1 Tax=Desertimonas flava TaxID=2064846 RepID=UPI0023F1DBAE